MLHPSLRHRRPHHSLARGYSATGDCKWSLCRCPVNWIACFGVPSDLTSDRGPQFTSALWTEISRRLGVKLHRTAAYLPQANGLVERFHRSMKTALKARLTNDNWLDELPSVMLGIRTAPKEDLNALTDELVYGKPLTVPGEFLGAPTTTWTTDNLRAVKDIVSRFIPTPTSRHGKPTTRVPLEPANAKYIFQKKDGSTGSCHRVLPSFSSIPPT